MSLNETFSDDYVAELLKKDAKNPNVKFSAFGLHNGHPSRPMLAAPKPNTRFLRNIIRETDQHNANLLMREAEQSKSRLRALRANNHRESRAFSRQNQPSEECSRNHDERHRKRRRVDWDRWKDSKGHDRHRYHSEEEIPRNQHRRRERDVDPKRSRDRKRHAEEDDEAYESDLRHSSRNYLDQSRRRGREREVSTTQRQDTGQRRRHDSYSRSRSPSRYRERESRHHRSRRKKHELSSSHSPNGFREHGTRQATLTDPSQQLPSSEENWNSDPLEAIIGPPPPPPEPKIKARGRGVFTSSTMDSHFASSYDPSVDVQPNPDSEDDWDQALEALRDRQRWRQQGAERLRSAGFSQEEVSKWEKGGEKREEDVRWGKRGEKREWDRGKVVDMEGDVDTKPEWGRLKGS